MAVNEPKQIRHDELCSRSQIVTLNIGLQRHGDTEIFKCKGGYFRGLCGFAVFAFKNLCISVFQNIL